MRDTILLLWHHGSFPLREVTYVGLMSLAVGLVVGVCIGRLL